jgi:threonylcarbamoyladenosine tRNA methylthiotransferase MtaB
MSDVTRVDVTRVNLETIGCKLNQAETELLARQFADEGYLLVSDIEEADVCILNTCTVTLSADSKCRQYLRSARQRNPRVKLVATGCYAERSPEELAEIGDIVCIGNYKKAGLVRRLEEAGYLHKPVKAVSDDYSKYAGPRTRAFIKVQDGCHARCSYCVVPLVRSREESVAVEMVISEVKRRIADGYKEFVLTGTNIGRYDCGGFRLRELIEYILTKTGVARLRISSLQPGEIQPELISLWQDKRMCRHLHLSLQSGSDGVLRRMGRSYTSGEYENAVSLIRVMVPGVSITTDIIVAFPAESEEEFRQSYDFCRRMEFARIHVFPYSARQGTEAALLEDGISGNVKKRRTRAMLALAEESARSFHQRFIGKTATVLWEKSSGEIWSGLTDNYIKVYTSSTRDLANQITSAKTTELWKDGVWGELV